MNSKETGHKTDLYETRVWYAGRYLTAPRQVHHAPGMALIKCGECGKEISSAAAACPGCGFPVAPQVEAIKPAESDLDEAVRHLAATMPVAKKKGMGCGGAIVVALVCIVGFAIAMYALGGAAKHTEKAEAQAQDPGSAEPVQQDTDTSSPNVTAARLFADYDSNEVSADDKYKGKHLLVTGQIRSIDKDFLGKIVLDLSDGRSFNGVRARMIPSEKNLVSGLSKGQVIVVSCVGAGMTVRSPILNDCHVDSVRQ
jgi:hypothetical protein